jgi:3-methyladenine DNA glycosylase/8-oxoguanine DNA glycosylase
MSPSPYLRLPLPEDARLGDILAFHGRDPDSPSERVVGDTLHKATRLGGRPVRLRLRLAPGCAEVRGVGVPLRKADLSELQYQASRLLALAGDAGAFEAAHHRHPHLGPLLRRRPGLRIPQTATVFEALVWAILGQQVNLAFAFKLRQRVIRLAGEDAGEGLFAHPTPEALAGLNPEAFAPLQLSRAKAACLVATAQAVAAGDLPVEALPQLPAAEVVALLTALKGIGPWTAQYVLLRGCGHLDGLPLGDSALATAVQRTFGLAARPTGRELEALLEPFRPWRSLATHHLWASLKDVPA